jgi:hypothetical protein
MLQATFFGGRSSHGARPERPRRSVSSVQKSAIEDLKAKRSDPEELRRRRDTYSGELIYERRRDSTTDTRPRKSKKRMDDPISRTVTVIEHPKRQSSTSSAGSSRKFRSKREEDRKTEYVYGTQFPPTNPLIPAHVATRNLDEEREPSVRSGRSRRSAAPSLGPPSSLADSLPGLSEKEVTPDDSISQVATRAYKSRPRTVVRERTPPKSHALPAVVEEEVRRPSPERASPVKPPKKRRESFIDTIFRKKPSSDTSTKRVECLTCSDELPSNKTAKLSCGHRMCHSCLKRLFRMAVNDPAHMPPRCCTSDHIPLSHVEDLFDMKFKVNFNKKYDEYHARNRIYCPNSRCGIWIRPSNFHTEKGRKCATCPKCKTKACTMCAGKFHRSADCPQDPEIARLVQQAEKEGWKRCYQCNAMVELREGCNHMKCRCTAEFCMVCGDKWKTCDCPWFNHREVPDTDRLNGMRVAEPMMTMYRRVFDSRMPRAADGEPVGPVYAGGRGEGLQIRTYTEEMEQRRRQEHDDAELARRMQAHSIVGDPALDAQRQRHRRIHPEEGNVIALGNAAEHFMNDDFRRSGRGPGEGTMINFGDAAMGMRGERASGRKKRVSRASRPPPAMDGGLVGDFLGSESILGMGPSRPRRSYG